MFITGRTVTVVIMIMIIIIIMTSAQRYFDVAVGLVWSNDPESNL